MIAKKIQLLLNIFWFVVATSFVFGSIMIVINASGYVINWQKLTFVKTGLVSISSNPKEAKIYLSGKLQKKLTPTRLNKLPPNWYDVKISYTDYQDWEEGFSLKADQAVTFDDIYLFYKNPIVTKKTIDKVRFDNITSPKNLLIEKNELYYISSGDKIIVTRFGKNIDSVDWIIKNKYLIVKIDHKLIAIYKDGSDQKELYSNSDDYDFIVLSENEIAIKSKDEIIVLKVR